jgi:hypothetical protein
VKIAKPPRSAGRSAVRPARSPAAGAASKGRAEKLARELSTSKYIGETEKNLDRLFGRATTSEAALTSDESAALFGKDDPPD